MQVNKGTLWKHTNGQIYKVVEIANAETQQPDKYPVTVVYANTNNGTVWSRPLSDWHRSFTLIGANTPYSRKDVRVETYVHQSGGWGPVIIGVRVTHLPTGLTASCHSNRSEYRNLGHALQQLQDAHCAFVKGLQQWPEDVSEYGDGIAAVTGGEV